VYARVATSESDPANVDGAIKLFESEEAMRRGDEALNAMSSGASERRTAVEFYEVPVQTVS